MKKLLKHLSPFAPDDSGACSVLYELGGIVVICDAGGCAGNVCGFDEPRWFEKRSALFSAGLRDMDAILGRDDRLVAKLALACQQADAEFTAIVGTPVPAVIATDYKALERMSEKRTGLPCITIASDGTKLYDRGEEEAYLKLFKRFAVKGLAPKKGRIGMIGATPMDLGSAGAGWVREQFKKQGHSEVVTFGMDSGLDEIRRVGECDEIAVIAPAGIRAAEWLERELGIRHRVQGVLMDGTVKALESAGSFEKALIVHQQFAANETRKIIGGKADCGTFFMLDERYAEAGDIRFRSEEDFREKVLAGGYDLVIGDEQLRRAVRGYTGRWIDVPHFAVSGRSGDSA